MPKKEEYSFSKLHKELSQLSVVNEFKSNLCSSSDAYDKFERDIFPEDVLGYFQMFQKIRASELRYLYSIPERMKVKRSGKILEIYLYGKDRWAYIKGEIAGKAPQLNLTLSRALA